jgi:hypothetical protein
VLGDRERVDDEGRGVGEDRAPDDEEHHPDRAVGDEEGAVRGEPLGDRREERGEERRRDQLGDRDDPDAERAGRAVRVDEDRDPRPELGRDEGEVGGEDADEPRDPEDSAERVDRCWQGQVLDSITTTRGA